MIKILLSGPLATVQDLGRTGLRNLGIGTAGAMDTTALQIGNLLVGNDPSLAGIEFTLGGFSLQFETDTVFSLTGADAEASLDGDPVPAWWVRHARAGQELRAASPQRGMRSYLCAAGGIDVASVMGSRSTDLKGGFGGHDGRALQRNDRLPLGVVTPPEVPGRGFGLYAPRLGLLPPHDGEAVIRFLPAAEWERVSTQLRHAFVARDWSLRPDSNRMGYRFDGEALAFEQPIELHSHGILPGTIQLPPDGQPVIQLNDANTCGGYPKLGVVIAADLPRLAQLRLGYRIRFEAVNRATALAAAAQDADRLNGLPGRIALAREYAKRWGRE